VRCMQRYTLPVRLASQGFRRRVPKHYGGRAHGEEAEADGKEVEVARIVRRNLASVAVLACLAIVLGALGTRRPISAEPPEDATYVGVKKCKECHEKRNANWKKMKHSLAWKALSKEERTRPGCYRCHVTGHGKPGGFLSEKRTPRLTAVQCESCHGPGSAHYASAKAKEPKAKVRALIHKTPQNTCIECHNPHKKHDEYAKEAAKEAAEEAAKEAAKEAEK